MKFNISVNVKNADQAKAVERALKERTTMATVLVLGTIADLNKDQQKRVMVYVADRFGIKL